MGKLFEIKNQLDTLLAMLEVDEETGEIKCEDPEMVYAQIEMLTVEKEEIVEYCVRKYKDTGFLEKSVDDQIADLKKQTDRLKKKQEGLLRVIDRECNGEKKDYGFATVNYRKSETVEYINGEDKATLDWLMMNKCDSAYTVKTETKVLKPEVKKLIKNGVDVPGAYITSHNNCSVR